VKSSKKNLEKSCQAFAGHVGEHSLTDKRKGHHVETR